MYIDIVGLVGGEYDDVCIFIQDLAGGGSVVNQGVLDGISQDDARRSQAPFGAVAHGEANRAQGCDNVGLFF